MPDAISIRGLRELNLAFSRAGKASRAEIRSELKAVAEPVRQTAQQLAATQISHIGPRWAVMRVGVTQRLVYVAPKERGARSGNDRRRRRPNLAGLLMDRAMEPALERHRAGIEAAFDRVLDHIADVWEA